MLSLCLCLGVTHIIAIVAIFFLKKHNKMLHQKLQTVKNSLSILLKQLSTNIHALEKANLLIHRRVQTLQQENIELQYQAIRDPLTHIFNRRYLTNALEHALALSKRKHHNFALLLIDIDNFKIFNDTFGHPVGDRVLEKVSHTLKNHTRSYDTVGRMGGEEFLVIMPESTLTEALQCASHLRTTINLLKIAQKNISISVGIAVYPMHGNTIEALLSAADKALYQAKAAGRNCAVSADTLYEKA